MKKDMDYIYTDGNEQILIETVQRDAKVSVVEQYVKYRKAKKMTQEELARRSGVSRPNIARFESGKYNPSLEMMVRVAAALDMRLKISLEEKEEAGKKSESVQQDKIQSETM